MPLAVLEGRSLALDPATAVAEATASWVNEPPPELILVFTSPVRSASEVAAEFAGRFPTAQIVGCTTAGEHLSGSHLREGLVAAGLRSPSLRWATGLVEDIASADEATIQQVVHRMFDELGVDRAAIDPARYFCLAFIDGLAGKEESLAPLIADALEGIAVLGGSAGDDLAFRRTEVIRGAVARSGGLVLALCESQLPFTVFKHQHFHTTPTKLAITRADPHERRVFEIDGIPAAQAYARALGLARAALTADIASRHPLTFSYQHQLYVRSVRLINPDDSLSFYCAIEEGMVVDVCSRGDLLGALDADLQGVPRQPAAFLLGANCVLRALETTAADRHEEVGAAFRRHARHMIGFDTYGEQLNGLHINHTLVALSLGTAEELS